jgi:uncharacterized protein YqkB
MSKEESVKRNILFHRIFHTQNLFDKATLDYNEKEKILRAALAQKKSTSEISIHSKNLSIVAAMMTKYKNEIAQLEQEIKLLSGA